MSLKNVANRAFYAGPRFEFRAACDAALQHHPELRDTTIFLMTAANDDGGKLDAYGATAPVNQTISNRLWQRQLRHVIARARTEKTSFACFYDRGPLQAVVFTPHSMLAPVHPHRAAMLFFEFDHELGHMLTRAGRDLAGGTNPRAECAADAYATLRAIQRFGADAPHLRAMAAYRARALITCNARDHVTAPLIDAILSDAARMDFSQLTPDETVTAANEYVRRHASDKPAIAFTLRQFRDCPHFETDRVQLIRLSQLVLATKHAFAFKVGARAVMEAISRDRCPLPAESRQHIALELQKRALALGLADTVHILRDAARGLAQLRLDVPPARHSTAATRIA